MGLPVGDRVRRLGAPPGCRRRARVHAGPGQHRAQRLVVDAEGDGRPRRPRRAEPSELRRLGFRRIVFRRGRRDRRGQTRGDDDGRDALQVGVQRGRRADVLDRGAAAGRSVDQHAVPRRGHDGDVAGGVDGPRAVRRVRGHGHLLQARAA